MASSSGQRPRGTDLRSRDQNLAYYREGGNQSLQAGGYSYSRHNGRSVLAGPGGSSLDITPPPKAYQRFLLAEFLACVLMICSAMILVPAPRPVSYARQLVQLTAVCLVFFILALAGGGQKTGKVSAAFGGLVTLAVAWHLSEMWSALTQALGGQSQSNKKTKKAK